MVQGLRTLAILAETWFCSHHDGSQPSVIPVLGVSVSNAHRRYIDIYAGKTPIHIQ